MRLTARQVSDLVAEVGVPGEPDVRRIDEGGEHPTWSVGDEHVARFAADGGARQRRENALRDLLRDRVDVPGPRSISLRVWAGGLSCTVDERLPGVSAESRPVGEVGERDLAALLRELRSVPVRLAAELGVPRSVDRSPRELRERARNAAERLAANGQLHAPYEFGDAPCAFDAGPVLLHADLKGEHLLVDESGAISGVLDWTDVEIGDPATDIAGLAISVGARASVRIARQAGYAEGVCARALFLARCDTLVRLDERLNEADNSPERLLRTQLDRAWIRTAGFDAAGQPTRTG